SEPLVTGRQALAIVGTLVLGTVAGMLLHGLVIPPGSDALHRTTVYEWERMRLAVRLLREGVPEQFRRLEPMHWLLAVFMMIAVPAAAIGLLRRCVRGLSAIAPSPIVEFLIAYFLVMTLVTTGAVIVTGNVANHCPWPVTYRYFLPTFYLPMLGVP